MKILIQMEIKRKKNKTKKIVFLQRKSQQIKIVIKIYIKYIIIQIKEEMIKSKRKRYMRY